MGISLSELESSHALLIKGDMFWSMVIRIFRSCTNIIEWTYTSKMYSLLSQLTRCTIMTGSTMHLSTPVSSWTCTGITADGFSFCNPGAWLELPWPCPGTHFKQWMLFQGRWFQMNTIPATQLDKKPGHFLPLRFLCFGDLDFSKWSFGLLVFFTFWFLLLNTCFEVLNSPIRSKPLQPSPQFRQKPRPCTPPMLQPYW